MEKYMFKKSTIERDIYESAYIIGYSGAPKNNPYTLEDLASAWDLGYNAGLGDKKIIESATLD